MKSMILALSLAAALMFSASPAMADRDHRGYDRHDRVERHLKRDHRRYHRAERRHAKRYHRVSDRHYRRHYRGYREHRHYRPAPRYFRQHAYGHRCGLRYRHYHGHHAYFGTLEAYLLGEVAREIVYQVFDD